MNSPKINIRNVDFNLLCRHGPRSNLVQHFLFFSISNSSDSGSSSGSVHGESFFLHNPQEVMYNRVKDLFDTPSQRQPLSALTGN